MGRIILLGWVVVVALVVATVASNVIATASAIQF
jgi:hypothetical protein